MLRIKTILLIHHWGGLGGAGVSLLNNIKMLEKDFDITVMVPNYPPEMTNELKKYKVKIIEIPIPIGIYPIYNGGSEYWKPSFYKSIYNILKFNLILNKHLTLNKYNIILVNSFTLFWVAYNKKVAESNLGCFIRETLDNRKHITNKIIIKILKEKFKYLFLISEYDKKKFELSDTGILINDCIFFEKKHFIEEENDKFEIIFLGGFNRIKGLDVLLRAIMKIDSEKIKLTIAGNCEVIDIRTQNLKNQISSLAKRGYTIDLLGQVSNTADIILSKDALVFPSIVPHQARPLFEAGFLKVPVIISDSEVIRERIKNRYNGLTFSNNDPNELALCLKTLMDNNELKNTIIENNYTYALKNHNCKNIKEILIKSLNDK